MSIEEENILIAEFMGFVRKDRPIPSGGWKHWHIDPFGYFEDEEMLYHSSWDWQIPAWSKLHKEIMSLLYELPVRSDNIYKARDQFEIFEHNYASAISVNSPQSGFGILVLTLEWYNTNLKNK